MPREYSHMGCSQCKRRKKKCDEKKPDCGDCTRLHLVCEYSIKRFPTESLQSREALGHFILSSPVRQVRLLPSVVFRSETEEAVLRYAPSCVHKFYTPLSDAKYRDLHLFWQLILKDDLVRDAAVACFSIMHPIQTPQLDDLNRKAYGRALREVRRRIGRPKPCRADELSLQMSIPLLGVIESVGPGMPCDPLHHWKALAALMVRSKISPERWKSCPHHLYLIQLETLMYHFSLLAPFCSNIHSVRQLWLELGLYNKLQIMNPRTGHRTAKSPFLAGQYEIYTAVHEVTYLLRTTTHFSLDEKYLRQLGANIQYCKLYLRKDFCNVNSRRDEFWHAQLGMYLLFCNALMICLSVLRQPSTARTRQIERLVAGSLNCFMKLPVVAMNNAPLMWPTQIIGCAIQKHKDWENFMTGFAKLSTIVDSGHVERAQRLFAKVQALRISDVDVNAPNRLRIQFEDFELPIGLLLLRQQYGLLS